MPITFINRTSRKFKPRGELAAINAHNAHSKHERRRTAVRESARRQNVQILSLVYIDKTQREADTVDNGDALILPHHIGSLRDDPFWTLPVENTHEAWNGFDYHFQVLCPLVLSLGNLNPTQYGIMRTNVLETAMYCSSVIALNLIMQSLHVDSTKRLSRPAMFHLGNAVAGLREALGDEDPVKRVSDIVLGTIFPMAVVYRLLNDYAAYTSHVEGVRRIVALRGGLDSLGWEGFSKISAVGMFESFAVLQRSQTQLRQYEVQGLEVPSDSSLLIYPSHPFPDALRLKISKLPPGLASLALNRRLSLQFLSFFQTFSDWLATSTSTPGPHDSMTELGHDILGMAGLSFTERVLATAVQAYLNYLERTRRRWSNFSSEHEVQVQIEVLRNVKNEMGGRGGCEDGEDAEGARAWACLMMRDTTTQGTKTWQWAGKQLASMRIDEEREKELDRLFFARPGSTLH